MFSQWVTVKCGNSGNSGNSGKKRKNYIMIIISEFYHKS